jgi:Domain of unknown function (DUF4410)
MRIRFFRFCRLPGFFSPAAFLLLGGCASVSVGNIHPKGIAPKKLPSRIYVQEFASPYESFRVDRSGGELEAFVIKERHALAANLAEQLTKHVAPAEVVPLGQIPPRGDAWLVTGTYDRVNQGSRALRVLVGFGAGGTKMETRVQVSNLSGKAPVPFLTLLTTGGSGMSPGAWAAFTPALIFFWPGAVANAGGASLSGISVDRSRTAREIAATLSEYCSDHGLIPKTRIRHPKKLGLPPSMQRPDFMIPNGAS